jgi:hypothetical protein
MGSGYIPRNNEEFDTFFKNILLYVTSRTIGASPAWTHIPAAWQNERGNVGRWSVILSAVIP